MPYDDDDDLFGEEFDFVDDDDDDASDDSSVEEPDDEAKSKPKKRPVSRDKDKAEKPASRAPKRARPAAKPTDKPAVAKREPRRESPEVKPPSESPKVPGPIPKLPAPPAKPDLDAVPVGYLSLRDDPGFDDEPSDIEPAPQAVVAEPTGPPADHLVHIYEHGVFKRTIARKFTDEQAVNFAEEYTRTGKPYGRYAIATPDDEEPAPTFAGAAKG